MPNSEYFLRHTLLYIENEIKINTWLRTWKEIAIKGEETFSLRVPGQPVSRILSWMDIYLDGWLPSLSSGLPGDDWDSSQSRPQRTSLLLDLAPHGGCLPGNITEPVGGLLHRHFTLTLLIRKAVCFLWPCSKRLHASGRYPACCPVVCGLSSDTLCPRPSS